MRFRVRAIRLIATSLALLTFSAHTADPAKPNYIIRDTVQQGALVRGYAEPGSTVTMNGELLPLSENGDFVFAVARAYTDDVNLAVTLPSGVTLKQAIPTQKREFKVQRIDGLPQDKVTPPRTKDVNDRIWTDLQLIRGARDIISSSDAFTQQFIWPVDGIVTGVFGSQRILNGTPKSPHSGLDIAGPEGEPVVAPADGIVTLWHEDMYFTGGTLIVDHGHGVSSTFIHLSKTHVQEGDEIKRGQLIAEVGSTGRATGPHLHWSMNLGKVRVDPLLLLPPRPAKETKP